MPTHHNSPSYAPGYFLRSKFLINKRIESAKMYPHVVSSLLTIFILTCHRHLFYTFGPPYLIISKDGCSVCETSALASLHMCLILEDW